MSSFNQKKLLFLLRWALGGMFIWASIHKISDPAAFARIIYGYSLFPAVSINMLAIAVPFIELVAGVMLIAGPYKKSALLVVNFLLILFIFLIGINLLRGYEFDCGCFTFGENQGASSAGQLFVRDIILLICGIYLFFREFKPA